MSIRKRRVTLPIRFGHFRIATENWLEERALGEKVREVVRFTGAARSADQRGLSRCAA